MSEPSHFRVEHRDERRQPCRATVMAVLTNATPTTRALDPFLNRLIHEGKMGWAVLGDDATGDAVVRRRIVWPVYT